LSGRSRYSAGGASRASTRATRASHWTSVGKPSVPTVPGVPGSPFAPGSPLSPLAPSAPGSPFAPLGPGVSSIVAIPFSIRLSSSAVIGVARSLPSAHVFGSKAIDYSSSLLGGLWERVNPRQRFSSGGGYFPSGPPAATVPSSTPGYQLPSGASKVFNGLRLK